jgi:hypothetical protein
MAASSPFSDPGPFALFGALLVALAAAAGQVLRSDPLVVRRLVHGLDGVRRATGRRGGGAAPVTIVTAEAGGSASGASIYADRYDTIAGRGPVTFGDASGTLGGSPDAMRISGQPTGSPGGQAGGLGGPAKATPHGFDGLANGSHGPFGGVDGSSASLDHPGLGHDGIRDASGHAAQVQPGGGGLGNGATHPTDWGQGAPSPADAPPHAPLGGQLGGAGGGGGELAKAPAGPGVDVAHGGLGGSYGSDALGRPVGGHGQLLAHGPGAPGGAVSSPGLGAGHGPGEAAGPLGHSVTPPGDAAGLPSTAGVPDLPNHGTTGGESGLGDGLARARPPLDGSALADPGTTAASEPAGWGFGPAWLAAGALARDDRPSPAPRLRTFPCPACGQLLNRLHRFCGYCGEPQDKTLS